VRVCLDPIRVQMVFSNLHFVIWYLGRVLTCLKII